MAFTHIPENSGATPGLFNSRFSELDALLNGWSNGSITTNLTMDSAGTVNINQGRLLSIRTLAASAVTVSAGNTNLRANEIVFTVGGASGASLAIHSGGTVYIFNSALSAKAT